MAAATFTLVKAYNDTINPPSSLRKDYFGLLVTDGSNGASAGDIPASTFGMNVIEEVSVAVKDDDSLLVVLAPEYSATGESTGVIGKAAATAAAADIPSGTYAVRLKGY